MRRKCILKQILYQCQYYLKYQLPFQFIAIVIYKSELLWNRLIITNTSMYMKTTLNHVLVEIILSEAVPFLSIIMDNTIWSSLIVIGVTWSHEQNGRKVFRVNGVSYVVFYEQNLLLDKLVTTSHSNKNRFPSIFFQIRDRDEFWKLATDEMILK